MKIKIFITCLFFLFSANSFAEWTEIGRNEKNALYIDSERIRKDNLGHIYVYVLMNHLNDDDPRSTIAYFQCDCDKFSFKILKEFYHRKLMGVDRYDDYAEPKPEWNYIYPESGNELILKYACENL